MQIVTEYHTPGYLSHGTDRLHVKLTTTETVAGLQDRQIF